MAGDYDRQRIAAVRGPHRAARTRFADGLCNLAVTASLPIRDVAQRLPHGAKTPCPGWPNEGSKTGRSSGASQAGTASGSAGCWMPGPRLGSARRFATGLSHSVSPMSTAPCSPFTARRTNLARPPFLVPSLAGSVGLSRWRCCRLVATCLTVSGKPRC